MEQLVEAPTDKRMLCRLTAGRGWTSLDIDQGTNIQFLRVEDGGALYRGVLFPQTKTTDDI